MILHGNQRGGAKDLAMHLLKPENEHVEVYELRGFASENLVSALNESYAISRGTRAKQFLFSVSLNPPSSEDVSTETFEDAINRIEKNLGLDAQPRAIVFHEKKGRRHCHAVWSRIDAAEMKAIPMPFTKYKLMDISRELYRENHWKMPRGMVNSKERDPTNFTLAQWQQAKRTGKDPRAIKAVFKDCWAMSDNQAAFQQALKERGYTLAKGDRRGFVALDHRCEVFAVAKWSGIKAKDVRAKLTNRDGLPSVAGAKKTISNDMARHLTQLKQQQNTAIQTRIAEIEQTRLAMSKKHVAERSVLQNKQQQRHIEAMQVRQARYSKGLHGLLDRLTGKHKRIKQRNEQETEQAQKREIKEKDELIFKQQEQRRVLQERIERLENLNQNREQALSNDISQYQEIANQEREVTKFDRNSSHNHSHSSPTYER